MLTTMRKRAQETMTEERIHKSKTIKVSMMRQGKNCKDKTPHNPEEEQRSRNLRRGCRGMRRTIAEQDPQRRYRYVKLSCTNLNPLVHKIVHRTLLTDESSREPRFGSLKSDFEHQLIHPENTRWQKNVSGFRRIANISKR